MCGEPSYDEEFGVADVMILLDMRRLNQRYLNISSGDSISRNQPDRSTRWPVSRESFIFCAIWSRGCLA